MENYRLPDIAVDYFIQAVQINAPSGQEKKMSDFIIKTITEDIGFREVKIDQDLAHLRISGAHPIKATTGNLFVTIPASQGREGLPCVGFNAHMDRVEPGLDIKPIFPSAGSRRIVSHGDTILAADDVAGIAAILTMLKVIRTHNIPHPKIQCIFTICEEYRLLGARYINSNLIEADMIFSFDGLSPQDLYRGACSSIKFEIAIKGKTAHAGLEPDKGYSAPLIFAKALSDVQISCFFGKIIRADRHIASTNINISGFEQCGTNSVQPRLDISGEVRAFSQEDLNEIYNQIITCFHEASDKLYGANISREDLSLDIWCDQAYKAFSLTEKDPIIQRAVRAMDQADCQPEICEPLMGGCDANWLNQHVPTCLIGTGTHNPHQLTEYLDLEEFFTACRIAINLATAS